MTVHTWPVELLLRFIHKKQAESMIRNRLPGITLQEFIEIENELVEEWNDRGVEGFSMDERIAFINTHAKIFQIADVLYKERDRLSWHDSKEVAKMTKAFDEPETPEEQARNERRERMGWRWKDAYDWGDENW